MKEIDETPLPENESEDLAGDRFKKTWYKLVARVAELEKEVADLHHRRRVSRQQAVDQDPEWH